MSKKGNRNNLQYNRQSAGYQKNLYRQKLNSENIKAPKTLDSKKFRMVAIGVAAVWVIISILLIVNLKWWAGLLIAIVIGAIGAGGLYLYLRNKQHEMIRYYKKIGLTEEQYLAELRRRKTDPKQIEAFRKVWRKVKI